MPAVPVLTLADVHTLVTRYLAGETIATLATEFHCARATLYNWMHSDLADHEYPDLVRQAMLTRMAQADDALEAATTKLEVARSREIAKFTRWDIERRLKLFQPKQEISSKRKVVVIIESNRMVNDVHGKSMSDNIGYGNSGQACVQPLEPASVLGIEHCENSSQDVQAQGYPEAEEAHRPTGSG